MGGGTSWGTESPPPIVAPVNVDRDDHWRHFDNSVNAVSFGFVATAILISMFLIMAIFERLLRPRSNSSAALVTRTDLEARNFNGKIDYPSPKMRVYGRGVSVLMPGERVPTFIAQPAPAPCPPERVSWPLHLP